MAQELDMEESRRLFARKDGSFDDLLWIASLAYLVLGILWFFRFVKFWKDIIQLHYYISIVISLGMFEMALWYFEYVKILILLEGGQ